MRAEYNVIGKFKVKLHSLVLMLSKTQRLSSKYLVNHQQQVAYLTYKLAVELGFSADETKDAYIAALLHDMGAMSIADELGIIEHNNSSLNIHAFKGAALVRDFVAFSKIADIIRHHHINWNNGDGLEFMGVEVSRLSHLVHLADSICLRINAEKNVISQIPHILKYLENGKGTIFIPEMADAAAKLLRLEYIPLDIVSENPFKLIDEKELMGNIYLDIDDLLEFARMVSNVIDFRSSFTAAHSSGVAQSAKTLASLMRFSETECKLMQIAGYFHDIGKLAISNEILEKPGSLDPEEYNEMRAHTYHTYRILSEIPEFDTINKWASFHHERLDGRGYPFHINKELLPFGSRIMAVADIFTAITEDRPYREGMSKEQAVGVLDSMVKSGALDINIVEVLKQNYSYINDERKAVQDAKKIEYRKFLKQ